METPHRPRLHLAPRRPRRAQLPGDLGWQAGERRLVESAGALRLRDDGLDPRLRLEQGLAPSCSAILLSGFSRPHQRLAKVLASAFGALLPVLHAPRVVIPAPLASESASPLLVGLEARCLDDRPPARVLGTLDLSERFASRPRNLEAKGLDPGADLGIVQGVDDCRAQAFGNARGRACRGIQ